MWVDDGMINTLWRL